MGLFRKREKQEIACSAIVVAAGHSSRMGELEKILLPLDGIPCLVYSLSNLSACPYVREIVIVTRRDLLVQISELVKEYRLERVSKIILGGSSRMESVQNGLVEIDERVPYIAVHDGARPFASPALITRVIEAGERHKAAAPALPVRDSLRRQTGSGTQSVEREGLFAVQTPQVFDADLLRAAIVKAINEEQSYSDDCSAVEALGLAVYLTEGDPRNMKLTLPEDLAMMEGIAQNWAKICNDEEMRE